MVFLRFRWLFGSSRVFLPLFGKPSAFCGMWKLRSRSDNSIAQAKNTLQCSMWKTVALGAGNESEKTALHREAVGRGGNGVRPARRSVYGIAPQRFKSDPGRRRSFDSLPIA